MRLNLQSPQSYVGIMNNFEPGIAGKLKKMKIKVRVDRPCVRQRKAGTVSCFECSLPDCQVMDKEIAGERTGE